MKKEVYVSGQKIGELIFIEETEPRIENSGRTKRMALFQCECGSEFIALIGNVVRGLSKRCSICKGRHISKTKITHGCSIGGAQSEEYIVWASMMNRCYNPNNHAFADYGERGIKVCGRWQKFELFLEDMGKRPTSKHTLDRIENNKGYSKGNCRWATKKEQANNRRSTLKILYGQKVQSLQQWAEELGLSYSAVYQRIKDGWSIEKAFETPIRKINARRKSADTGGVR